MREITYREAIREALMEEMQRAPGMLILGEDLLPGGGTFGIHQGFGEMFPGRVLQTPISEAAIIGTALGAAMTGGPVVAEIMYADFMAVCMDEIVNQAAKIRFMSGGQARVPLVIRAPSGATRGVAAQHSQSLEAWFAHVPGLKVAMPATPADAKGLLKSALRGEDPVVFLESKLLYGTKGMVPEDADFLVPLGQANRARPGEDLTIIATGLMLGRALEAAERLARAGLAAEVIDPRTVQPIDWETIFASVDRTGRVLIVNEATLFGSVASEIAATISEKCFLSLDGPVRRLGAPFTPKPSTPALEALTYPGVEDIMRVVREMFPRRDLA